MCSDKASFQEEIRVPTAGEEMKNEKYVEIFNVDVTGDIKEVRKQAAKIPGYRSMGPIFCGGTVALYEVNGVLDVHRIVLGLNSIDGVWEARVNDPIFYRRECPSC